MHKTTRLSSQLINAVVVATFLAIGTATAAPGDWVQIWSDEFNGTAGSQPDLANWTYEVNGDGGGNGELQYYTSRPENSYLEQDPGDANNRVLVIKGLKETYLGKSYTSARLKTAAKREFTYGKVEMRATLPYGQGIWPAFWMLGNDIGTVSWPTCGEIDIMEFIGKTPNMTYGTIHGPAYNGGGAIGAWHRYDAGFSAAYHTWAVEWDPEQIAWYFDGQLFEIRSIRDLLGTKEWVFDHPFFIILNLAIGGSWPGSPDATTIFPQYYRIDYVRVFQREGSAYPPPASEDLYKLQAVSNSRWVSADKANGDIMIANRTSAGSWELFDRKDLGGGMVALLAKSNYKYVSATGAGNEILAVGESQGTAEKWQVITNSDGTTSFRGSNGNYMTVNSTDSHLFATATAIGATEKFNFVKYTPASTSSGRPSHDKDGALRPGIARSPLSPPMLRSVDVRGRSIGSNKSARSVGSQVLFLLDDHGVVRKVLRTGSASSTTAK